MNNMHEIQKTKSRSIITEAVLQDSVSKLSSLVVCSICVLCVTGLVMSSAPEFYAQWKDQGKNENS